MNDRLKILDCNRKSILTLPANAFKLLMTYYMNEDEEQESYLSQPEIKTQNGMSFPTISTWTQYLVRHGWLIDTGKKAHEKLLATGKIPSANSKQVVVYRVDDPTHRNSSGATQQKHLGVHPTNTLLQGSSSCSGFGSDSRSRAVSASIESQDSFSSAARTVAVQRLRSLGVTGVTAHMGYGQHCTNRR